MKSRLERLPTELLLNIMELVPDLACLNHLCLASPRCNSTFEDRHRRIIEAVVRSQPSHIAQIIIAAMMTASLTMIDRFHYWRHRDYGFEEAYGLINPDTCFMNDDTILPTLKDAKDFLGLACQVDHVSATALAIFIDRVNSIENLLLGADTSNEFSLKEDKRLTAWIPCEQKNHHSSPTMTKAYYRPASYSEAHLVVFAAWQGQYNHMVQAAFDSINVHRGIFQLERPALFPTRGLKWIENWSDNRLSDYNRPFKTLCETNDIDLALDPRNILKPLEWHCSSHQYPKLDDGTTPIYTPEETTLPPQTPAMNSGGEDDLYHVHYQPPGTSFFTTLVQTRELALIVGGRREIILRERLSGPKVLNLGLGIWDRDRLIGTGLLHEHWEESIAGAETKSQPCHILAKIWISLATRRE